MEARSRKAIDCIKVEPYENNFDDDENEYKYKYLENVSIFIFHYLYVHFFSYKINQIKLSAPGIFFNSKGF